MSNLNWACQACGWETPKGDENCPDHPDADHYRVNPKVARVDGDELHGSRRDITGLEAISRDRLQSLSLDDATDRKRAFRALCRGLLPMLDGVVEGWLENGEEMENSGLTLTDHIESNVIAYLARLLDIDAKTEQMTVGPAGRGPFGLAPKGEEDEE